MNKRHHYRRRSSEPAELDMTTFLNLMVVLVPFLLITAVFSRITIVELSMPSSTGGTVTAEPGFRVEVVVREGGLEVGDGSSILASLPKLGDEYDLDRLSEQVMVLKQQHPGSNDASVLLEPQIEYDHLIEVMDAVRSTTMPAEEGDETVRVALFTDISIGDAP